jgi:hypothetical protein
MNGFFNSDVISLLMMEEDLLLKFFLAREANFTLGLGAGNLASRGCT